MGYNQNNAGIHIIPLKKSEGINYFEKHSEMIVEAKAKHDKKIIEDVEICNFCQIAFEKGKTKKCRCGGYYTYHSQLPLKYHSQGRIRTIVIAGKICKECGRKLFLRHIVLNEIENDLEKETGE